MIDQPDLKRVPGEARDVVQVELPHQVGAMIVDRLDADAELLGDLLRAVAFRHEFEELAFAIGERLDAGSGAVVGDDRAEERPAARSEIRAALRYGAEALFEFTEAGGLLD